jgi:membrane-bound hydrogenase subunit beta
MSTEARGNYRRHRQVTSEEEGMKSMDQTGEIVNELQTFLGKNLIELKSPRARRIFARVEKDSFRDTLTHLIKDMNITQLSTITGTDLGQEIELLYHFAGKGSIVVTIGIKVPKDSPTVRTITDLVPGAVLYEREIHEVLGVDFEGHPNLLPLILPEGWPQGVYPLRKEQKFEELRKIESRK